MADLISRLKLESGEFDSKIKRAGQELMAYSEHCKKMGLEMGYANKDAKEFAKALGSMQTTSSSARGKINELTEAFVNLKVMYKNMTDEEKNNTFGKNLAASLDQLKTRIDQAKTELNDVNKELGNTKQAEVDTKGGLDGLTSALGINIKTLAGWGTAIAAGKVALDVAKDAFFASESSVDEWGRTVASSQSLYEGFLTAINNGDISGYLSNIDSIVKAARLAYDELDKLGTMKTIQAPQISKQQTENERIRSMIQTGRYIAPQDGRRNTVFNGREMQTGDKLTAGQIRALERQLQGGMQKMVKLVGNEVDQTGKAINAYYDKLAKQNGMSLQEFKKGTSSWAEFNKRMQGYEDYKKFENEHSSVRERYNPTTQEYESYVIRDQKKNPYQQYAKWGTFRVDKEGDNSYKDLVALIQQRDQQVGQVYSTQAQAYRTMNRAEGVTVRKIMGGTGGKGGKGGTIDKNLDDEQKVQQKINDLLKEALTADANRQGEIRQQVAELQKQQEKYKDIKNLALGILPKDKEAVFTIDGQLSEETKKNLREIENVTIDDKTMTVTADTQEAMQKVQELIGQVSTTTLQMKVSPPDLDKLFPDMSKENYNTGYAGSAQAKYDSARADLALGPMNFDAVNDYIGSIKGMLKDANLGDELYTSMTEKLKDATTVSTLLQEMMERGLAGADLETTAQALKEKLLSPEGIDQTAIQSFLDTLNAQIEEAGGVGLKLNSKTGEVSDDKDERDGNRFMKKNDEGKYEAKMTDIMSGMAGGINNVVSGLNTLGVEIPAGLQSVLGGMQAITSILSGIAVTAMAIEAIAGADAIIPFANGGIVPAFAHGGLIGRAAGGMMIPGNSMSGDRLRLPVDGGRGMIGVNSGELILNRAQQGIIASQLEGGGMENLQLDTVIGAEDIKLILNNRGRRTGRGEYVQSRKYNG